jgi:predicted nucleotidyltransferase
VNNLNSVKVSELVDKILSDLFSGIEEINPGFIKGFYITGSILINDFHISKSDIDFIILCHHNPDKNFSVKLKRLHKKIQKQYKRPKLSGVYLTNDCLKLEGGSSQNYFCL